MMQTIAEWTVNRTDQQFRTIATLELPEWLSPEEGVPSREEWRLRIDKRNLVYIIEKLSRDDIAHLQKFLAACLADSES